MRTSFLLLSAVLVLAACDDAAETTAPRSRSIVTPAAEVSPTQGQNASGKPAPAFTTVTSVESGQGTFGGAGNVLGWLVSGTIDVACPAGTQVIGGGYDVTGSYPFDMKVYTSKPNAMNGWRVRVENTGSAGSTAYLKVTAICIK